MLSTHVVISSKAASRVFQFASPRSVIKLAGISSVASASASSGVCLYLKLSRPPAGAGAPPFPGFDDVAAAAAAAAASAGGFFPVDGAVAPGGALAAFLASRQA